MPEIQTLGMLFYPEHQHHINVARKSTYTLVMLLIVKKIYLIQEFLILKHNFIANIILADKPMVKSLIETNLARIVSTGEGKGELPPSRWFASDIQ